MSRTSKDDTGKLTKKVMIINMADIMKMSEVTGDKTIIDNGTDTPMKKLRSIKEAKTNPEASPTEKNSIRVKMTSVESPREDIFIQLTVVEGPKEKNLDERDNF